MISYIGGRLLRAVFVLSAMSVGCFAIASSVPPCFPDEPDKWDPERRGSYCGSGA